MRFQIVNIEPAGFRFGHFLDYYCKLLCYSLESLGHDCVIACNQVDRGRINILLGAHALTSPNDVQAISSSGRYIVVQSEIIRPNGINLLRNEDTMFEVYVPLLMGAEAVWEAIPANLAVLGELGIRAIPTRCGYHPRLEDIAHKRNKDLDFSFFGSTTQHRVEMLAALKRRGHNVAVLFDARHIYRDDILARTKVHLSPNQGADMNHLPYGRICYLLNNCGLVVVEECYDQKWLEHCFVSAATEHWVDRCDEILSRKDRPQLAEKYYEAYRQLPMTEHLEAVLEQTFGSSQVCEDGASDEGPKDRGDERPKDPETQGPEDQGGQRPRDPKTQEPRDPRTQRNDGPGVLVRTDVGALRAEPHSGSPVPAALRVTSPANGGGD